MGGSNTRGWIHYRLSISTAPWHRQLERIAEILAKRDQVARCTLSGWRVGWLRVPTHRLREEKLLSTLPSFGGTQRRTETGSSTD